MVTIKPILSKVKRKHLSFKAPKQTLFCLNLLKPMPGFVYIKGTDGKFLGCNDNLALALGLANSKKIVGKTNDDFAQLQQLPNTLAADKHTLATGEPQRIEETFTFEDGQTIILSSSKRALRDDDDEITGVINISENISERVYLKNIMNFIPSNVYWKDKNGVYLGSNKVHSDAAGLASPLEIIGKTDTDMPWKDIATDIRELDKSVIASSEKREDILYPRFANGQVKPVHAVKAPLRNEQGEVMGIVGISVDISNIKTLERKLKVAQTEAKKNKMYLENILAIAPSYIYWKDTDGVYRGYNDKQAKMLGLEKGDDVIGRTDYDMPWKDQADELRKNDLEVMETGESRIIEEACSLVDGKIHKFISEKVPLLDEDGNITGVLGISTDVTELKEKAEKLGEEVQLARAELQSIKKEMQNKAK